MSDIVDANPAAPTENVTSATPPPPPPPPPPPQVNQPWWKKKWLHRMIYLLLSQVVFGWALWQFHKTKFVNELIVKTIEKKYKPETNKLHKYDLGANLVVFFVQLIVCAVCWTFGPFQRDMIDRRGGYAWKAAWDTFCSVAAVLFLLTVSTERKDESGKKYNLVDSYLMWAASLWSLYSLFLSFLLQPKWDFTILGLLIDVLIHMSTEMLGVERFWTPFLATIYVYILYLARNWHEAHARKALKPTNNGNNGDNTNGTDVIGAQP